MTLCVDLHAEANGSERQAKTIRIGARQKVPAGVLQAYVVRDILIPDPDIQVVDNELNRIDPSNS